MIEQRSRIFCSKSLDKPLVADLPLSFHVTEEPEATQSWNSLFMMGAVVASLSLMAIGTFLCVLVGIAVAAN